MASLDEVERLARRVTPDDLRYVTPADIQRTMATMTPQQLEVAMKVMVRENKFGMVARECRQDTYELTIRRLDRLAYFMASRVLLAEPHNLQTILGRVPESWKDACEAVVRRKFWQ